MRFVVVMVMLMSVAGVALAGDEGGRAQVRAATADAVSNLLEDVSRISLTRNLSVGEFLRRTNSTDELVKVLQRAQQVGGPRWVDDHTCQIELQISGPVVAGALNRIAAANPRATPISPRELARVVKEWDERSFSATGAATSRLPAVRVRGSDRIGHAPGGWQEISQKARDQAVAAAKLDAARRSMSSVRPITLTPRSTVGDALAVKGVGEKMQEWYVSQPAARVELTDDMEALVELEGTPAESFATFHDLAVKQKDVPLPPDEREWGRVKDDFERRMVTPIGRAVVPMDGGAGEAVIAAPKPLALPSHTPAWAHRRLEATGSGMTRGSKLMAARDGEAAAEAKLRRQIEELELTPTQTVGQAAKADPRVERAINRALARTRIAKADYHADDSAEVSVYLDLGDFWQELRDAE
jgi:hypothetical protein